MMQQAIGKYRLIEQLGQGGMGTVYRAKSDEAKLERFVALKVILPSLAQNPEFINRFKREAQTIVDLSPHPHIVPLIDYEYSEQDGAYLVMEFMNGGTLHDWLQRDGSLSLYETARIYKQICSALARAHKANIIHRDIKPSNIFLDEDNNAYLGDFGIARHSAGTQIGFDVAGTYGYAAPEQIMEDQQDQLTFAADIYSAGIVLYECLSGVHPFAASPMQGLLQAVPDLPTNSVDYPDELDAIIAKATQFNARERYSTILALDDALQRVAAFTPARPLNVIQSRPQTLIKSEQNLIDFVFISHSPQDDELVERITTRLEENAIDVWVDHRYLESSDDWDDEIQQRLNSCHDGILVLSKQSLESPKCMAEWRAILARGKKLYPLVIDEIDRNDFSYRLDMEALLDLREDFDAVMQKLIGDLHRNRQTLLSPDFETELDGQKTSIPTTIPFTAPPPMYGITSIMYDALVLTDVDDVPLRADEFMGREQVLDDIEQSLSQKRKVLLQGFGGVGKTTLAAEFAARHIGADKGHVLWLQVGNNTALSALNSLIRALEPSNPNNYTKIEEGKPKLRELLAAMRISMIVFDDVWSDGHELKSMMDALPSSMSVLLTSRQRYPVGKIIDIDILPLDEALALLSHHASQEFDEEDSAAVDLCSLLGNHPLALEIAGKTMVVDYLMVEDLLRRIENAPHLMQMPEHYSEEGRESIKGLLDASIAALDSNSSEVFLSFGLFPETALSAELIAACLGQTVANIREQLINLVRRGLAKPERSGNKSIMRYRLHNLAHSYTRTNRQLDSSHAIRGVKAFVDEHIEVLDALDVERNNILKIAAQARAEGKVEDFLHILYALTVTSNYLKARGYVDLLLQLMDRATETSRERGEKERLHFLLGRHADAYSRRGKYEEAIAAYEESIQLADELEMEERAVIVRSVASRTYVVTKQFDKASEMLDKAEEIADKATEKQAEYKARILEGRLHIAVDRDGWVAAMPILEVQVELAKKSNNVELLFGSLINLGVVSSNLKNFTQAQPQLEQALKIAKENNNQVWEAVAQRALGLHYHEQGKREDAQKTLNLARQQFTNLSHFGDVEELEEYMKEQDYEIEDSTS